MSKYELLEILRGNFGFDDPEAWLAFARREEFEAVDVQPIYDCPDCGGSPRTTLGSFVHFSSLIRILECGGCGLYWANAKIDDVLLLKHFEVAYKSDDYFRHERRSIFQQLASLAAEAAPDHGAVLDIGGATGVMLDDIRSMRPDLSLTLQDISTAAVQRAIAEHDLDATDASVIEIADSGRAFDVVVLSDVIYYEMSIRAFWEAIRRLMKPGGSVIVRVPNKLALIRASALIQRGPWGRADVERQAWLRFFNPEHMLICTRGYLENRLRGLGFQEVTTLTSPPLGSGAVLATVDAVTRAIHSISGGRLVLSPSMVVKGSAFGDSNR